jgi:spore coat polysaccharide biosynthesis predicted glycosyltransferase SpsG
MGDDDLAGEALTRTRQLLEMPKIAKVAIAARTHHPRYDEILELTDASDGKAEVVTESKELMTRLVRVHFALTSGDAWSPELCVVGVPQLILSQTKRHAGNGKKLDEDGVATYLGSAADVSYDQLKEAVDLLLDDPMERKGMTRCARNTFDGRGPDRIVNGLEIMLHNPVRKRAASTMPLKIAA